MSLLKSLAAIISLIILYAICLLWIDKPLAVWIHQHSTHGDVYKLSSVVSSIFNPSCWMILAIISGVISMFVRQQSKRCRALLYFALTIIVAYFIAFVFKVVLARYRPSELFQHNLYGFHWFSLKHAFNSTPSGHATTAFAGLFAIGNILNKAAWKWVLGIAAILIALARLVVGAHFMGDVIFGAYIGILCSYWFGYLIQD